MAKCCCMIFLLFDFARRSFVSFATRKWLLKVAIVMWTHERWRRMTVLIFRTNTLLHEPYKYLPDNYIFRRLHYWIVNRPNSVAEHFPFWSVAPLSLSHNDNDERQPLSVTGGGGATKWFAAIWTTDLKLFRADAKKCERKQSQASRINLTTHQNAQIFRAFFFLDLIWRLAPLAWNCFRSHSFELFRKN